MDKRSEKKRTIRQCRALHKYFELLAQELNDMGLDMKKTLKPEVDIPWTGENVKRFLWLPVMKTMFTKEHTAELTTIEIDRIFDVITRHLGERFSISIPFPSIDELIKQYEDN